MGNNWQSRFLSRGAWPWNPKAKKPRSAKAETAILRILAPYLCRNRPEARRRIFVIILLLAREPLNQIAKRLQIGRSTIFAYQKLYRAGGLKALLSRTKRGRPRQRGSYELDTVLYKGLRKLRSFNIPTLIIWVRHCGVKSSPWMIRRRAVDLIEESQALFPLNWRTRPKTTRQPIRRQPLAVDPRQDELPVVSVAQPLARLTSWHAPGEFNGLYLVPSGGEKWWPEPDHEESHQNFRQMELPLGKAA